MPPQQCPTCGRFLKKTLVESLADGPQACPGCEVELRAEQFPTGATAEPDEAGAGDIEPSVRPPDLPPSDVRDDTSGVLEGWDVGATADEVEAWRDDRSPVPVDAYAVGVGGLIGVVVGALVVRRRDLGALVGGVVGALLVAVLRQVWRSP